MFGVYRTHINQMDGRRSNGVGCLRFILKDYYSLFMWNQLIIDTLIANGARFWRIEWNSFKLNHRIPLNALLYNWPTLAWTLALFLSRTEQNKAKWRNNSVVQNKASKIWQIRDLDANHLYYYLLFINSNWVIDIDLKTFARKFFGLFDSIYLIALNKYI